MKNAIYILTITLSVLLISCTKNMDKVIEKDEVEETLKEFKQEMYKKYADSRYDAKLRINLFNHLLKSCNGRENYLISINSGIGISKYDDKRIVDEETFNETIDSLYNYFEENDITYKMILKDYENYIELEKIQEVELNKIGTKIYNLCWKKQRQVEDSIGYWQDIKKEVESMVSFKLLGVKDTLGYCNAYIFGADTMWSNALQFRFSITNNTDEPIDKMEGVINLYDPNNDNNIIESIYLLSEEPFASKLLTINYICDYSIDEELDYGHAYQDIKEANWQYLNIKPQVNHLSQGETEYSIRKIDKIISSIDNRKEGMPAVSGYNCPYPIDEELRNSYYEFEVKQRKERNEKYHLHLMIRTLDYRLQKNR